MSEDPYAKTAKGYDSVVEPFVRKLRTIGMKMFPLHRGVSVLDVGCGTGTHLDIYQKTGCRVFGIDSSPAMLDVAQMKLAGRAKLHLGDASRMPFPDESFDLVQAVLVLHEMPAPIRSLVVDEAKRVMKKNGRFLVIDYHPVSVQLPTGWPYKIVITLLEILAGWEHFRNYRDFIASGGLLPLIAQNGLQVDKRRVVGGGTLGLYLLSRSMRAAAPVPSWPP